MFIPIRAQFFSLLVTLVFVATELGALWAAKTFNVVLETRRLRTRFNICLRRHCRRLRIIAALLLISFLALEALTSNFTHTAFRDEKKREECLRLVPLSEESAPSVLHDPQSEIILFRCLSFDGTLFGQSLGSLNLASFNVSCEERSHYSYNNSLRLERSTSSAQLSCRNFTFTDISGEEEVSELCSFHEVVGNVFFLSARFFEDPPEQDTFFSTVIQPDVIPLIPKIIERYFHFFLQDPETEELYAREVMFTDLIRTQCLFPSETTEGVTVSTTILAFLGAIWVSVIISVIVLRIVIRKKILINLSDPFVWTRQQFENGTAFSDHISIDEQGFVRISVCNNERQIVNPVPRA
ncbi:hypothetical protein FGB62_27g04 [Gracilaria domingensis]|nr:hypothetical protein FGB62_27g04 [Gracilaria domingensis]